MKYIWIRFDLILVPIMKYTGYLDMWDLTLVPAMKCTDFLDMCDSVLVPPIINILVISICFMT